MSFILRIVQDYQESAATLFFELEAQFQKHERDSPALPKGRRYQLLQGDKPANVLVWECAFPSLAAVQDALKQMDDDPTHTELFTKQSPYIMAARTEIYKVLDL